MSLPETIKPGMDPCDLADRWTISVELAEKLLTTAQLLNGAAAIQIISGYRTKAEQAALSTKGRPTAADDRSTHRSCPATGADLWIIGARKPVPREAKLALAGAARAAGLRVGGGSPLKEDGTYVDWNHVDLGPRAP